MIVDDIQAGCGRTGPFFSFEEVGISPDIVTLSKSLSGFGLPFSVVLMKPELDQWKPGEHNGTFRGHNLAFVTARAAIEEYWRNGDLSDEVKRKGKIVREYLDEIGREFGEGDLSTRGRGMMQGLDCSSGEFASNVSRRAFERGLIIETSGSESQVVKCLSPLTISDANLEQGLMILKASVMAVRDEMAAAGKTLVGTEK